jgi:hypothetical protein
MQRLLLWRLRVGYDVLTAGWLTLSSKPKFPLVR